MTEIQYAFISTALSFIAFNSAKRESAVSVFFFFSGVWSFLAYTIFTILRFLELMK